MQTSAPLWFVLLQFSPSGSHWTQSWSPQSRRQFRANETKTTVEIPPLIAFQEVHQSPLSAEQNLFMCFAQKEKPLSVAVYSFVLCSTGACLCQNVELSIPVIQGSIKLISSLCIIQGLCCSLLDQSIFGHGNWRFNMHELSTSYWTWAVSTFKKKSLDFFFYKTKAVSDNVAIGGMD